MKENLEARVLRRVRPSEEEIGHVHRVAERLVAAVNATGQARGMVVGSVARHTWVSGDRDLDIFILLPPSLSREELEGKGLSIARCIAQEEGGEYREKYAEHPYINTTIDGLDIDLVPCFAVESATEIQSAVDRTPFHTRYIGQKIGSFSDDVLLVKQFTKCGGVYGSDQMTEGFSGYLCELLILAHKGFLPLLTAASSWRPQVYIDLEGHATKTFSEPLVVVDPVDPGRNVAASVSLTRLSEFIELARGYNSDPSEIFFTQPPAAEITRAEFERAIGERGTTWIGITFDTPPFIPEIVVPQLRKSMESLRGLLERNGFIVNRSDYAMGEEKSILLFELLVDRLPRVRRHPGPPVWSPANAEKFRAKYHDPDFTGPYIENGLYIVEVRRRHEVASALLRSEETIEVALGRHVRESMVHGWSVLEGVECWSPENAEFLHSFLFKSSPLERIRKRGGG
ncbi:MAG: CCA tRNA nucleotidyltransferase [Methanomicrobiales archaeon]|nr:CCA tRNA nucleotidyltransferase [Methanomicrobiales archaeon]